MSTTIPALAAEQRFPTPVGDVITKAAQDLEPGDKWLATWRGETTIVLEVASRWANGIIETTDGRTHYVFPTIMLAVLAS